MKLKIVFIGLSITSSWGNGHATTYRALAKALGSRGHEVTFLERDVPWYREHRDGNVTTADFVALCERRSGQQLDAFFDVWLSQPVKPTTW